MTRYLLDTNIISNATKPAPSESLIEWMTEQSDDDLFISSLTVAEIRSGILAVGRVVRGPGRAADPFWWPDIAVR